jgi:exodeoxyribonuclease-5
MTFKLSEDQTQALADLKAVLATGKPISVFVGPAGSGKTTIMKALIEDQQQHRQVVLCAPTGKAASVLAEKTGMDVSTIHSAIYGYVEEVTKEDDNSDENVERETKLVFGKPKCPVAHGGLVVVDEASMVGQYLHNQLTQYTFLAKGAQILYVGDREQLPPVNDTWGADFANPDAMLTKIHRQAEDSAILTLSQAIREKKGFNGWNETCRTDNGGDPVDWMVERAQSDATLLTYTNKNRKALNVAVRESLGRTDAIEVGDRIVCLLNSKGTNIMNGEVRTVTAVKVRDTYTKLTLCDGNEVYVNPELFGAKTLLWKEWVATIPFHRRRRALHIDYGYCLTVHKSQGSQWKDVAFCVGGAFQWLKKKDPDTARRLSYTAVTRASDNLVIFR